MEVCDSGTLAFTDISLQLQRGSSDYQSYEFYQFAISLYQSFAKARILLNDTTRSLKEKNINRFECQLHDKQRAGGT